MIYKTFHFSLRFIETTRTLPTLTYILPFHSAQTYTYCPPENIKHSRPGIQSRLCRWRRGACGQSSAECRWGRPAESRSRRSRTPRVCRPPASGVGSAFAPSGPRPTLLYIITRMGERLDSVYAACRITRRVIRKYELRFLSGLLFTA